MVVVSTLRTYCPPGRPSGSDPTHLTSVEIELKSNGITCTRIDFSQFWNVCFDQFKIFHFTVIQIAKHLLDLDEQFGT